MLEGGGGDVSASRIPPQQQSQPEQPPRRSRGRKPNRREVRAAKQNDAEQIRELEAQLSTAGAAARTARLEVNASRLTQRASDESTMRDVMM